MIFSETKLKVADNSGAKKVKCLKVLKSSRVCGGNITNIFVVSVQKAKLSKVIKKGRIYKAILIRQKKNFSRNMGTYIKSNENAVILVDDKLMPYGTRIFGPLYRELYSHSNLMKIISLSRYIV